MKPLSSPDRSYGQYCGLARSLDRIGDRWTLLIVRELLAAPRRFNELLAGLPGIATNLLTTRLRQLESDGLILRQLGPAPGDGISYALTPRGAELREAIGALLRWSTPLMASGRRGDQFRPTWLAVALPALLTARPTQTVRVAILVDGFPLTLEVGPAGTTALAGLTGAVAARLAAGPEVVLGLASGALDLSDAVRAGAEVQGDRRALRRVFGRAQHPPAL